ncbi:MAG: hypothetical protein FWC38_06585 [Proteobacteria bacterium]|nr:hypothetical protein [Pseudomonadota bacterium]MCL2307873.1 hypothetical protein [Pseudomonadota bacterium]
METKLLAEKLSRAIPPFLEKESYTTLKGKVGTHFFEDNRDTQWADEDEYFQIEFLVLDEWVDEDGKQTVYVTADARDGYQEVGAMLFFSEGKKGSFGGSIYQFIGGIPTDIPS